MDDFITQYPLQTMLLIVILAIFYAAFKAVRDLKKKKLFEGWRDRVLWWSMVKAFVSWGLMAVIFVGSGENRLDNPWVGFFQVFLLFPWIGLLIWVSGMREKVWRERKKDFARRQTV